MQYRKFGKLDFEVSALSMGCMRLPRIEGGESGSPVNREKAWELIRYAADHGINYFDSAWGYHSKTSEEVLGEALDGGRREKVIIATKQPYSVMADLNSAGGANIHDNARRNLENSLKKLRTSYIDVYLIHGIGGHCWEDIKKEKIIELYEKFRQEGMIKAIAFSYHGGFPMFKEVMEFYDWGMCQVQQNFMDTEREVTEEGIHLAGKRNCALVVMEGLRGGLLGNPPDAVKAIYDESPKKRKGVEWAFRHVVNYPEVSTVLSGVTTLEQLKEDIEIFSKPDMIAGCLSESEKQILKKVKAKYESTVSIPCTYCEYCLPCPHGVNIPQVFARYNDGKTYGYFDQPRRSYMFMTRFKSDVSNCAGCGECEKKCPQHIGIMKELKTAHEALKGWTE